ncbi:hypothetical protein L5M16_20930 [Shewanella sp. SM103]|jgi:hypothetical protein|nr:MULTISPECIES: hypothetical protein [unclassified Shewanella]MCU8023914.1 hypothetical protein [Shewanella sp. SM78]MCU8080983.1 hypothetical protein [Shewanella sp. SM103]
MMKHTVEVTQSALTQMLLNGFEAFVIKHGNYKRSGIEFHASIYGDIEVNDKEDKCRSIIQFISADTSAKMGSGSVDTSEEAEDLKEQLAEQMGVYRLGNMHSHPYLLEMAMYGINRVCGVRVFIAPFCILIIQCYLGRMNVAAFINAL